MPKFAWHIHHDKVLEELIEPIESRIAYIKEYKPWKEIATRLRLLHLVEGELPEVFEEAWAAYEEAWAACEEARAAYEKARAASKEAWVASEEALSSPEMRAFHAQECPDCPWDWGKETVFP